MHNPIGFRNVNGDGTYQKRYTMFRLEDELLKIDSVRGAPPEKPITHQENSCAWVPFDEFTNPAINSLPAHFVGGYLYEYPRWLKMGDHSGHMYAMFDGKKIYSVERIPELLRKTKRRLRELDIYNVQFRPGDGWEGWPKYGPYDGIIVAAAAPVVPEKLLEQLAPDGRLVMPVGPPGYQELMLVTRKQDHFEERSLGGVSFVPLVPG